MNKDKLVEILDTILKDGIEVEEIVQYSETTYRLKFTDQSYDFVEMDEVIGESLFVGMIAMGSPIDQDKLVALYK